MTFSLDSDSRGRYNDPARAMRIVNINALR